MQDRLIYADTTHTQVSGNIVTDFKKREVKVRAVPKAKRPEFFSLARPVGIKGELR